MRISKYIFLYRKFCHLSGFKFHLPSDYQTCIPTSWTCPNMTSWKDLVAQVVYKDVLDYIDEKCEIKLDSVEKEKLLTACYKRCVYDTVSNLGIIHNNMVVLSAEMRTTPSGTTSSLPLFSGMPS